MLELFSYMHPAAKFLLILLLSIWFAMIVTGLVSWIFDLSEIDKGNDAD